MQSRVIPDAEVVAKQANCNRHSTAIPSTRSMENGAIDVRCYRNRSHLARSPSPRPTPSCDPTDAGIVFASGALPSSAAVMPLRGGRYSRREPIANEPHPSINHKPRTVRITSSSRSSVGLAPGVAPGTCGSTNSSRNTRKPLPWVPSPTSSGKPFTFRSSSASD